MHVRLEQEVGFSVSELQIFWNDRDILMDPVELYITTVTGVQAAMLKQVAADTWHLARSGLEVDFWPVRPANQRNGGHTIRLRVQLSHGLN